MSSGPPEHGELLRREKRGLFRNAMTACLGQGGVVVFGLGAMMATTRLLGAEGYGRLTVFFMFLGVLTKLAFGWPNLALVRFGREEAKAGRGAGRVFWARAVLFVPCALVAAVAVALLRRPVGDYLDMGEAGAWILLAYAVLLGGVELLAALFQALGRFRVMAALPALVKALNCLLLVSLYAAVSRRSNAATVLLLHVLSVGCVLVWAGRTALRSRLGNPVFDPALAKRMALYAWPLVFGGAAHWTVEWVDTVALRTFATLEEVGIYGAAYQSVHVLGGLRAAVAAVLWPFVMSLAAEGRRSTLRWYLDDLMPAAAVVVGLALALAGAGAELMPWLFGREFAPAVLPCQTLVAGVAFTCVGAMCIQVANAYDRVGRLVAVSAAMAAVNLAGDIVLVPRMGPQGAALSTLAAFAFAAALGIRVVNGVQEVAGAQGRRYLSLLALAPALALPAVGVAVPALGWRLAAYALVLLVWAFSMRLSGIVSRQTLARLEEIDLPAPALWLLRAAAVLVAKPPEAGR